MAQKIFQRIAEQLKDQIRSGIYKPMARLPAERDLATEFDVSRTTIREALLALEAANLIKIKDRSGAYVQPHQDVSHGILADIQTEHGPHEVLQLRRLIEGEAAFLVALQGSANAIAKIEEANAANAAVSPDDTPEFHEATKAFHISITEGSENGLFVDLLDYLWEQKSGPLWETWYGGTRSRSNRQKVIANNQEITDAIVQRRAEAARTAMHRHIDWMIARFLSY